MITRCSIREGIRFVLLNGIPVVNEGKLLEIAFPGRAARAAVFQQGLFPKGLTLTGKQRQRGDERRPFQHKFLF